MTTTQEFTSQVVDLGTVEFPLFQTTRVMMMPFRLDDLASLPDELDRYRQVIAAMLQWSPIATGVGYLTIDCRCVEPGQTHRRPGLHVDGIGPDGSMGGWGGGGGWGSRGFLLAADALGARAWHQQFVGEPGPNGDCAHLQDQCAFAAERLLLANRVYWLSGMTVHSGMVFADPTPRSLIRISMPSDSPWYSNYTMNPRGVQPTGPVHGPRPEAFMRGL